MQTVGPRSETPDPTTTLRASLAEAAAAAVSRRARAMIPGPDSILGLAVPPLTPAAWSRLTAIGSPFVCGGVPREGDVRNYLWLTSRLYQPRYWWTTPTFAKWLALLPFAALLRRQRDLHWYTATLALFIEAIVDHVTESTADAPRGGSGHGSPGPALEAEFIHFCAAAYGWPPAYTRRQPLRLLFQLWRAANPGDPQAEETAAKIAHLRARNASALKKSPAPA